MVPAKEWEGLLKDWKRFKHVQPCSYVLYITDHVHIYAFLLQMDTKAVS